MLSLHTFLDTTVFVFFISVSIKIMITTILVFLVFSFTDTHEKASAKSFKSSLQMLETANRNPRRAHRYRLSTET